MSESNESNWKNVASRVLPNTLGGVFYVITDVFNLAFLGHAPRTSDQCIKLAAAGGLAQTVMNCMVWSISTGMLNALDTLVSQAHGANLPELCAEHLMRLRLIMTCAVPLFALPLYFFTGDALVFLGQHPEISNNVQQVFKVTVFSLWLSFQNFSTVFFLKSVDWPWVRAGVCVLTAGVHVFWCYLFIWKYDLGMVGMACADVCSAVLQFVLLHGVLFWVGPKLRIARVLLFKPTGNSFRDWMKFFDSGIPALLQMCLEWWYWEITVLLAGFLGAQAQAVQVALISLANLCCMGYESVGVTITTLVGHAVGQNNPLKVKAYAKSGCLAAVVLWLVLAVLLLSLPIADIYTQDKGVRRHVEKIIPVYAVCFLVDSLQFVLASVIRGLNFYTIAYRVYVICFYCIGMPLCWVLAFYLDLSTVGFWYATAICCACAMVTFLMILRRTSFSRVCFDYQSEMQRNNNERELLAT